MLFSWSRVVALVLLLAGLLLPTTLVRAQDATPMASPAPLAAPGYPELAITITETAFVGAPAELAAGRYLVTVTNALPASETSMGPESAGVGFMQLPPDLTAEAFIGMMAAPMASPTAGTPASSPDAGTAMASPVADAEMAGPPPWYYETTLAGGPYAAPGETRSAVIDLTAGTWVMWGESPGAPQAPVAITVTGEAPAGQPAPAADLRIETTEYSFTFPETLAAGTHVVELANVGQQPHFIGLARVPDGTTLEDVNGLFAMFDNPSATPAPDSLSFADIQSVLDTADQSSGVTAWYTVDLEPGTYLAVCFVPDQATGVPHAFMGMTQLVTVP